MTNTLSLETSLIRAGQGGACHHGMVNIPPYRGATILFDTVEEYEAAQAGEDIYGGTGSHPGRDFSYATNGTPTSRGLEDGIRALENAAHALVFPSGLSAITVTLLALLECGDEILLPDNVYSPVRRFTLQELRRFGITHRFYDPAMTGDALQAFVSDRTKILFLESPGSLTFEMQDIPALCRAAKKQNIITIVDNSWATGMYFRPLDHGADISLQACTKYIGGHADILLGSVCTNDDDLFKKILRGFKNIGACSSPEECYLAARGLRSLSVRLERHSASALDIAARLQARDDVAELLFPALPGTTGHELWKRDMGGAGGLFALRLKETVAKETLYAAINGCELFGIGASWGGFESLIMPFAPKEMRDILPYPDGTYIRLFIGLECPDDLYRDIENLLSRLYTENR